MSVWATGSRIYRSWGSSAAELPQVVRRTHSEKLALMFESSTANISAISPTGICWAIAIKDAQGYIRQFIKQPAAHVRRAAHTIARWYPTLGLEAGLPSLPPETQLSRRGTAGGDLQNKRLSQLTRLVILPCDLVLPAYQHGQRPYSNDKRRMPWLAKVYAIRCPQDPHPAIAPLNFAERLQRVKSNGLGEDEEPGGLLGEEA